MDKRVHKSTKKKYILNIKFCKIMCKCNGFIYWIKQFSSKIRYELQSRKKVELSFHIGEKYDK